MQHPVFIFAALSGGVFLGLILYLYDHPKRIKAYSKLEMPSQYLKKRSCDECKLSCKNKIQDLGMAIDTYFIMLTELFNPATQQRVFYIGSVYHLFADIRMLSILFGVPIIALSLSGALIGNISIVDFFGGITSGFALILFWLSLHPEFVCEANQSKGDRYFGYIVKLQKRLIDFRIDEIREIMCRDIQKSK